MKIEFLETYKHDGMQYQPGDRITVSNAFGTALCQAGLAIDLGGVVATEPRNTNQTITLDVDSIVIGQNLENANG